MRRCIDERLPSNIRGESAICGARIYCDLGYRGAACTGRGEMAMRVVAARAILEGIAAGREPGESCRSMRREAATLADPFAAQLRTLALCPEGRHGRAAGHPALPTP